MPYRHRGRLAVLLLSLVITPVTAIEPSRPVFKRIQQNGQDIEFQIDPGSVEKTWAYKNFWALLADAKSHQPLTITEPLWRRLWNDPVGTFKGQRVPWLQKFVVDCSGRRMGAHFIQSTQPSEAGTPLKAMHWVDLKTLPVVHHAICE